MLKHKGRTIRKVMRTTAEPEEVFDAWTDPTRIAEWFGVESPGEVVEATPGRRIVLRGSEPGPGAQQTEIVIEREAGTTVMRFVNSGFSTDASFAEEFAGIDRGWTLSLATLRHYLEHYPGGKRSNLMVMRPLAFDYLDLLPFYTTETGLQHWFTRSGSIGEPGTPYTLVLKDGETMSGKVLARTIPEVLVSWEQIRGIFAFKAFKLGEDQRVIALQAVGWDLAEDRVDKVTQRLDAALDRLVPLLR